MEAIKCNLYCGPEKIKYLVRNFFHPCINHSKLVDTTMNERHVRRLTIYSYNPSFSIQLLQVISRHRYDNYVTNSLKLCITLVSTYQWGLTKYHSLSKVLLHCNLQITKVWIDCKSLLWDPRTLQAFWYCYRNLSMELGHYCCFYWHGLTLIPAWISNYKPRKCGMYYLSIPQLQQLHRWSLEMDK